MAKSRDAFRTISEVADWLETPAHVLRFWESRFTQVKPIKRAGGRRYYRPADMQLLSGIKTLLHEDGLTIKGVQKILRAEGVKHVAAMSQPLGDMAEGYDEDVAAPTSAPVPDQQTQDIEEAPIAHDVEPEDAQTGMVLSFPNADVPSTDKPVASAPVADAPSAEAPSADIPLTEQTELAPTSAQEDIPAAAPAEPPAVEADETPAELSLEEPATDFTAEIPEAAPDLLPEVDLTPETPEAAPVLDAAPLDLAPLAPTEAQVSAPEVSEQQAPAESDVVIDPPVAASLEDSSVLDAELTPIEPALTLDPSQPEEPSPAAEPEFTVASEPTITSEPVNDPDDLTGIGFGPTDTELAAESEPEIALPDTSLDADPILEDAPAPFIPAPQDHGEKTEGLTGLTGFFGQDAAAMQPLESDTPDDLPTPEAPQDLPVEPSQPDMLASEPAPEMEPEVEPEVLAAAEPEIEPAPPALEPAEADMVVTPEAPSEPPLDMLAPQPPAPAMASDIEGGIPEMQAPEELAAPSEPPEEPAPLEAEAIAAAPEAGIESVPELEIASEPAGLNDLSDSELDEPLLEAAPTAAPDETTLPETPDLPDFVEEMVAPATDDLDVTRADDAALDFAQDLPASTPEAPEPVLEFSRASAGDAPADAIEPEDEAPAPEAPQQIRSISDLVLPDAADIPEAGKSFADDLDLATQDAEQVDDADEQEATETPADLTLDLDLDTDLDEEGDAFALPDAPLDTTPEQTDEPEALVLEPAGLDEESDALDAQFDTEAPSEMLDLPVAQDAETELHFDTLDASPDPEPTDPTEEKGPEDSSDTEVLSILAALKDPELDAEQDSEAEQPSEPAELVTESNAPELDIQNLDLPSEHEEESASEVPLPDSEPAEMPAADAPILDNVDAAMDLPETDLGLPDVESPDAPEPAIAESDVEEIDETEDTTTPASTDPDDSDTAFEVKTARHHLVGGKGFTPEERATIRELSERLTTLRKTYGNPVKAPQEN